MRKPDSLQGSLNLLVLKTLSRRPRLHGYAIMSAIRSLSDEVLQAEEGSLYPALHRMEEAGWLRAKWIAKDTGQRARVYESDSGGQKATCRRRVAQAGGDCRCEPRSEGGVICP